jgi:hypothetical protein
MGNGTEVLPLGALAIISKAEIDQQVATARAFPRSMMAFREEMKAMVTISEEVATECIFALPRGKDDNGAAKFIEGPSARFAEVLVYNFGNARAGARFLSEEREYVVCEGFYHDLEKNIATRVEVRRSILTKTKQRFNADMITVTANAACAIARRNAILQGIPKALWSAFYDLAKKTAIGDEKSLASKRTWLMKYFMAMQVTPERIFEFLNVKTEADITLDDVAVLKGIANAIKEGAVSVDNAFTVEGEPTAGPTGRKGAALDKINKAAEQARQAAQATQGATSAKCEECGKEGEHDALCSKSTAVPCKHCRQIGKHSDSCPDAQPPD